jgi:hypothetical protein
MSSKITSKQIADLKKDYDGIKKVDMLIESRHLKTSIYGDVESSTWPAIVTKIKQAKVKGIKWSPVRTISTGLWMIEFNGFSKSDFEITGYVTLFENPSKGVWALNCELNHVGRGKNNVDFEFKSHEDYGKIADSIAKHITSFAGM